MSKIAQEMMKRNRSLVGWKRREGRVVADRDGVMDAEERTHSGALHMAVLLEILLHVLIGSPKSDSRLRSCSSC